MECGFLSQWKKNPQEPDVIHLSHNKNINPLSNNTKGTHRRHFVFQTVTSCEILQCVGALRVLVNIEADDRIG